MAQGKKNVNSDKIMLLGDALIQMVRAPLELLHLSEIQNLLPSLTTHCSNSLFSSSLACDCSPGDL